jgi:hypothetical protein
MRMKMLAEFLRALGRRCFAWADALAPDVLTRALDEAYKRKAEEELAQALRREATELRSIRDELRGIVCVPSAASVRLAREIAREGQPRVTPFARKAGRVKGLR